VIDAVERASRGSDGNVVAGQAGLPIRPIWLRPQDMKVTEGLVGPEYGRSNGEDEVQHA
jgi:hypothetical protein